MFFEHSSMKTNSSRAQIQNQEKENSRSPLIQMLNGLELGEIKHLNK